MYCKNRNKVAVLLYWILFPFPLCESCRLMQLNNTFRKGCLMFSAFLATFKKKRGNRYYVSWHCIKPTSVWNFYFLEVKSKFAFVTSPGELRAFLLCYVPLSLIACKRTGLELRWSDYTFISSAK